MAIGSCVGYVFNYSSNTKKKLDDNKIAQKLEKVGIHKERKLLPTIELPTPSEEDEVLTLTPQRHVMK